jgi:hypothetical protein
MIKIGFSPTRPIRGPVELSSRTWMSSPSRKPRLTRTDRIARLAKRPARSVLALFESRRLGLLLLVACSACGRGIPTSSDNSAAERTCESYRTNLRRADLKLSAWSMTNVGEIRRSHGDISPWASLPTEQVVASCSFTAPIDDQTPSTRCPDGDLHALVAPVQVFVDAAGRTSADPTPFTPSC